MKSPKPPQPTEQQIKNAILDYLAARKIFASKRNTGAMSGEYKGKKRFVRFSEPGQSDIWGMLVCEPLPNFHIGQHFEIEVKRPGQKPTREQAKWLAEVRKHGGIAGVCSSIVDVEMLLRI